MKTITLIFLFISAVAFAQETSHAKDKMGYSSGITKITKEKILQAKSIEEILNGFPKEYEIVSYRLTIVKKNSDPEEFKFKNNQISSPVKEKIKSLMTGSKIFVEYIMGRMNGDTDTSSVSRVFPAGSFVIVEK